jgi:hypothetical protein|tara:strand:- start:7391 stop:7612 length:222 start_codon:yes stop_codon:yes gene_type:complete
MAKMSWPPGRFSPLCLQSIAVAADAPWVRLSEDGQRILVDAEGIAEFQGVFHNRSEQDVHLNLESAVGLGSVS